MTYRLSLLFLLAALEFRAQDSFALLATVELPGAPRAIAYDSHGRRLLAAGGKEGREYLVALATPAWQQTRLLNGGAAALGALGPTAEKLFLTNRKAGTISRFQPGGARERDTYLGQFPGAMAMSGDGTIACVLTGCDWHPGVYDTGAALRIVPLNPFGNGTTRTCALPERAYGEARAVCISADGKMAYIAASPSDYGAATLLAIDLATARIVHRHTIKQPGSWVSPASLILTGSGEPVLAIDAPSGSQLVLYTRELAVRKRVAISLGPTCLASGPPGELAVAASRGSNCLRLFKPETLELGLPFPSPVECPRIVAFDSPGQHLFVASSYASKLAILKRSPSPTPPSPPPQGSAGQERIVYATAGTNERVVWAMRPNGTDRRPILHLPAATDVLALSPDGTRVAYRTLAKPPELNVYSFVTGLHTRLTHSARDHGISCAGVTSAHWLPHGRALVYQTQHTMYETKLFIVSARGGTSYPLLDNPGDRDMSPTPHPWDPDRLLFLFDSGNWTFHREIRVFDRFTAAQWTILPRDGHTHDTPLWHPDGRHVFWSRSGTELNSAATIWSMRSDGTGRHEILPLPPPGVPRLCTAVSPDGARLLCDWRRKSPRSVYLVDVPTGAETPLVATANDETAVGWGPLVLPVQPGK